MTDSTEGKSARTILSDISSLAAEHGAVNLGSGVPDFGPPQHVLDALKHVATCGDPMLHQYCRGFGHIRLVNALSQLYSKFYNRVLNPLTNILIPIGANGGLACAIGSVVQAGDEILVFEPYIEPYIDMIKVSGATPVFIPLQPKESSNIHPGFNSDEWTFTEEYLLSHVGPNTKAILLNTPSNPLGKVFSNTELEIIRGICIQFDLICISDEVYEWLTFDGRDHVKIGAMEGMWQRSITIGSAGKTFSALGWKLGWMIGPEVLINKCQVIFQNYYYRCPTPIQEAVAIAIETEIKNLESADDCYLKSLAKELEEKRDWLMKILSEIGMRPIVPGGGYFLLAEISAFKQYLHIPKSGGQDEAEDIQFIKWAIKEKNFGALPASLFYSPERRDKGQRFVRICFAKNQNTLQAAENILRKLSNESGEK